MVGAPILAFVAVPLAIAFSGAAAAQQAVEPEAARGVLLTAAPLKGTEAPDSLVKALQETLDREVDRLGVPDIQASVRVGRFAWSGASGYKNLDRREPLLPSDILRVGSVTKTLTAGVVLKLSERGYIDLDAPIERWLPDWPHAGEITVRHLLNHTSGLRKYTDDLWFLARTLLFPKRVWQPAELAAVTRGKPLYFSSGTGHHYSNTNYVLLGLTRAPGHGLRTGPDSARRPRIPPDNTAWPTGAYAAGAIVSTAADLRRWMDALFTSNFLRPETRAEMIRFVDVTDPDVPDCSLTVPGLLWVRRCDQSPS